MFRIVGYLWCNEFRLSLSFVLFVIYLLFTNIFCLLNLTKNIKKDKSDINSISLSYFTLWYEWNNFVFRLFFTTMHVLNFVFWICVICFNNWNGHMAWVYYFTISRKRGPVEILARSSISLEPQTKANFKVTTSR